MKSFADYVRRTYSTVDDMKKSGFVLDKNESRSADGIYFFTHPKIKTHHFLINYNASSRGVMYGRGAPGSGISGQVDNINQLFHVLKNFIK